MLGVVRLIQGVTPERFLYQQEVGTNSKYFRASFHVINSHEMTSWSRESWSCGDWSRENWSRDTESTLILSVYYTLKHSYCTLKHTIPAPPTPTEVTTQVMDSSSVRVSWRWTSSAPAPTCFNTTFVTYHPEGGDESSVQLRDPSETEAILTDLQCLTNYTITVVAIAGEHRKEVAAFFLLQGMLITCMEGCAICNTVVTGCLSLSTTQVHQMLQCPCCLPPQYIWRGCLPATHSNIASITEEHVGPILMRADSVQISSSIPSMDSKKA